ncbi:unnamed protein product [Brassicogethes aeneus]|uniref:Uncharacterized protein n=1 Tax=Brassicogethes aeneus TaxID=1431903 RepID=A0A9P0FDC7_BRAAE|nr:unnamed protein product [Brassicogethes aeneus]
MSIFPLLLLATLGVGVAAAKPNRYQDDGAVLRPITTRTERRRICVDLCMSGLGGAPCGADCVDLTPQTMPLQSGNNILKESNGIPTLARSRGDACPVLCRNNLGEPLCECGAKTVVDKEVDFFEVCGHFCLQYDYQIPGCQRCDLYRDASHQNSTKMLLASGPVKTIGINWNKWCQVMCTNGEGGAACNCDLLPMLVAS